MNNGQRGQGPAPKIGAAPPAAVHPFAPIVPIPEEVDYTPDQWDDSELYPWDCDLGVPWTY